MGLMGNTYERVPTPGSSGEPFHHYISTTCTYYLPPHYTERVILSHRTTLACAPAGICDTYVCKFIYFLDVNNVVIALLNDRTS